MHAWICSNPIGPQALDWAEITTPEPAAGEVRVAIHAASLNFPDLLIVQNKYQFKPELPFVPGAEFAGVIDAIGDGVDGFKLGDRVASFGGQGGFGEAAVTNTSRLMALPPQMPFTEAAALMCTYGTSHHALIDRAGLQAGETVLVLGAAGGVGTAAIQIAKAVGANVIAATSSDEKCAFCRELGADATINYAQGDLREQIKRATGGKGPDVVYDPVGGDLAEPVFRSIGWRGRYLVIGFAQGAIPSLPLNLALLKGASVVGVFWGEFARREPAESARALAQLADWYAQGKIRPVIDRSLPMSQLPAAFARMGSREVRGKLVLTNF